MTGDLTTQLQERVTEAYHARTPLQIRGGGSKPFYGRAPQGEMLDTRAHAGIVHYQPTELVLTARAGTPLAEIEAVLAEQGQMLPFEPPHLGPGATLGGTIAAGLSGPRRPYAGAARDFVLGVSFINGRGERLRCGGEVMKNVAGYDLSRLMVGALGTLGLMLEISLKVLPRPPQEATLVKEVDEAEALRLMNLWAGRPVPLSAAAYDGHRLYLRLSGVPTAVEAAEKRIGGQRLEDDADFWHELREQRHAFFHGERPLWRLSLPPATRPLALEGKQLIEWGGAQRWLRSDIPSSALRRLAEKAGGHATLFRRQPDCEQVFHPLPAPLLRLHAKLKAALDPAGILNPGRLYAEL